MSGVFKDNGFTILNEWSKIWYQYQHSWQSGVNNRLKSRILNQWSQILSHHSDSLRRVVNRNLKFYNFVWFRLSFKSKSTVMREICLQWEQVYIFWMCGVNNETSINILDKVESIITQNSITFTELEDCRHEYLRLWMSGVFDDQKFTILSRWSQQCSQHRDSLQNGANNTKIL